MLYFEYQTYQSRECSLSDKKKKKHKEIRTDPQYLV